MQGPIFQIFWIPTWLPTCIIGILALLRLVLGTQQYGHWFPQLHVHVLDYFMITTEWWNTFCQLSRRLSVQCCRGNGMEWQEHLGLVLKRQGRRVAWVDCIDDLSQTSVNYRSSEFFLWSTPPQGGFHGNTTFGSNKHLVLSWLDYIVGG
jgi:hypothetical protein